MSIFDVIAENQIQDWNRRKAEGKIDESSDKAPLKRTSFEAQLFHAIIDCYHQLAVLQPETPKWTKLDKRAEELRIQLMINLERHDMHVTAKMMTEELSRRRAGIIAGKP
ncbi:hypothetical protein [Thaumasiovibrio sp. DFM-14]|uniref:hypothetical protein n=1 Tax=Thaumasiovibrio sp. DFM-14 TaxID=3384792 RepID=UPI00399F4A7A